MAKDPGGKFRPEIQEVTFQATSFFCGLFPAGLKQERDVYKEGRKEVLEEAGKVLQAFCNFSSTSICPTELTEAIDVAGQHTWVRPATRNHSTGSITRVGVLEVLQIT